MIQGQLNGIAAHNVQQMNNNRAQLLAAYPGRSAPQPPWVTAWPWQGHATSCILPGPPAAAAVADSNQVAWRYRCHSAIADPPPPYTHTPCTGTLPACTGSATLALPLTCCVALVPTSMRHHNSFSGQSASSKASGLDRRHRARRRGCPAVCHACPVPPWLTVTVTAGEAAGGSSGSWYSAQALHAGCALLALSSTWLAAKEPRVDWTAAHRTTAPKLEGTGSAAYGAGPGSTRVQGNATGLMRAVHSAH